MMKFPTMPWRLVRAATAAALSLSVAQAVCAAPVVLNFNDLPGQSLVFANLNYNGFVFSPSCHLDVVDPLLFGVGSSNWMGFDLAGCTSSPLGNAAYLGPRPVLGGAQLFVRRLDGAAFSLEAFDAVTALFSLESSRGGSRTIMAAGAQAFSGSAWTQVDWLLFSGGGGEPRGFDNLRLDVSTVPEPNALALVGLGLLAAMGISLRPRRPS